MENVKRVLDYLDQGGHFLPQPVLDAAREEVEAAEDKGKSKKK